MSFLRFKVVDEAIKRKALDVPTPEKSPSEYYGMYVFNEAKMLKYLPQKTFAALLDPLKTGKTLDRAFAHSIPSSSNPGPLAMAVTHPAYRSHPLT